MSFQAFQIMKFNDLFYGLLFQMDIDTTDLDDDEQENYEVWYVLHFTSDKQPLI